MLATKQFGILLQDPNAGSYFGSNDFWLIFPFVVELGKGVEEITKIGDKK